MSFYVDLPDETLASQIEHGPQYPCWNGDELCAFRPGGPCLSLICTCETTGTCESCRGIPRVRPEVVT